MEFQSPRTVKQQGADDGGKHSAELCRWTE